MLTSEKPLCSFVQLGGYQTHEAIQPELGDVGDAEQAGLGGVEAVRPVLAEGQ